MQPAKVRSDSSLPPILSTFLIVAILAWVACLGAEYVSTHYLHLTDYRYQRLTLEKDDDFADARMFPLRMDHFHEASFFDEQWGSHFLYPAPDAFIYRAFEHGWKPAQKMVAGIVITMMLVSFWFFRQLRRRGLALSSALVLAVGAFLTSYPFFFEFNRANVEIYVWLAAAAGIWAFLKDRPWLAATLIGVAGALKGYPYIYLGLLFARKQYRQMVYSLFLGFLINYISLWALTGNIAVAKRGVAAGLDEFRRLYILQRNAVGLDHSFFGFFKRFTIPLPPPEQLGHILTGFLIAGALVACAAYFFRIYRMPVINQVIFLAAAAITLPPTSYDYTLLHVYTGWALLVFLVIAYWRSDRPVPVGVWPAFICYMLLLTPQNEIILHGERLEGQIKCLALISLAAIAMIFPFRGNPAAATTPETVLS